MFTDCPSCNVPEEGKLIKYSHQMSPPPEKELFSFSEFPRMLRYFFYVQVPEECLLIVQAVLYLKKLN